MPASSCTGPLRRREFLRLGALALGGLRLDDLIAARAAARQPDPDTSVILFWMWGGPSQFETYDPKPDAPGEYRGPFRPISTTVPGMDLCELFPLKAKLGDRIALIRSLHHTMSAHNDGSVEVLTGKTPVRPEPRWPLIRPPSSGTAYWSRSPRSATRIDSPSRAPRARSCGSPGRRRA